MKRLSESFIDDVIRRSRDNEERKEDKTNNIKDLKPVDMGGSVLWADRDYESNGEYLFDYEEASIEELATSLKGWRLPTIEEANELLKKSINYTDHCFERDGQELKFEKRGLSKCFYYATSSSKKTQYKMMDEGNYYYGWTSTTYNPGSHHIFTFDESEIYVSPINNRNLANLIIQPDMDKLCMRLVRDK